MRRRFELGSEYDTPNNSKSMHRLNWYGSRVCSPFRELKQWKFFFPIVVVFRLTNRFFHETNVSEDLRKIKGSSTFAKDAMRASCRDWTSCVCQGWRVISTRRNIDNHRHPRRHGIRRVDEFPTYPLSQMCEPNSCRDVREASIDNCASRSVRCRAIKTRIDHVFIVFTRMRSFQMFFTAPEAK